MKFEKYKFIWKLIKLNTNKFKGLLKSKKQMSEISIVPFFSPLWVFIIFFWVVRLIYIWNTIVVRINKCWNEISINFVEGLPRSKECDSCCQCQNFQNIDILLPSN